MDARSRTVVDAEGRIYRVHLTPRETAEGPSPRVNSLTFETWRGRWVGALPVYPTVSLESLSDRELLVLLQEARVWG